MRGDSSGEGTYARKGRFAAFLDTILLGFPGSGTISCVGCGFAASPLGFKIQDIVSADSKAQWEPRTRLQPHEPVRHSANYQKQVIRQLSYDIMLWDTEAMD